MKSNDTKVAVIGGDSRMLYAANCFASSGCECAVFANDLQISEPYEFTRAYTLTDALGRAELILLPIPLTRDGYTLNAPFCAERLSVCDVIKHAPKAATVCAGALKGKRDFFGTPVYDYGEHEYFASKNGALTAEGAICLAIDNSNISLLSSKCAVFGFGRIGKALASRLMAMGALVTVFARDKKDMAFISHLGMRCADYKNHKTELSDIDFVFNTVPDKDIASLFASAPSKALIIDLASTLPSSERVINGSCLPSVYSPKSAGVLIYETVKELHLSLKEGAKL